MNKRFKKVENNTNVKPQMKNHINPNKVNKSNGLYAKLRDIRSGKTEAVITYHFEEEITHHDYKGKTDKEATFKVVSEKGKTWTQVTTINPQVFFNEKGGYKQLDDVLALFVESTADRGAKRFEI